MRRLAVDYAFRFANLAPFFAGNPADSGAWAGAIARARAHQRPRAGIVSMLRAQQDRRGSPPAARAAVDALADPTTVAIVTGQQAGLFGGPLFTLLKAVTTIRLATRLRREHQIAVVPVFWIDSEDHDWDEIAGCGVFAADQTLRTYSGGGARGRGRARHRVSDVHERHLPGHGRAPSVAPAHRVHARPPGGGAGGLPARPRRRRGVWTPAGPRAWAAGTGRLRRLGSGGEAVCGADLPPRARTRRRDHEAGRHRRRGPGRARVSHAGHAARERRGAFLPGGRTTCDSQGRRRLPHRRRAGEPRRAAGPRRGRGPRRSARTSCCARSCRTPSSPPSATSRAPTSWRIWVS